MQDLDFARKIHQHRHMLKLSLREISRRSGIAASTISRIENGLYSPTLDNALKLATALGIELPQTDQAKCHGTTLVPAETMSSDAPKATGQIVTYNKIRITTLKPGIRRNLSKIAARNSYRQMILLKGAIQVRTNHGFRENLRPGATLDCAQIVQHTYFAVAAEEAEALWIG